MFQTIMNKILWDLINTREVANFINDVIVGTDREEEYNKVVEEVVKRLAENNLYVKPEKCKWKVREVEFLEVVIVKIVDDGLYFIFSFSFFYFTFLFLLIFYL